MAGYARRSASPDGPRIELTPHAREWIDRIWEPLRHRGMEMLAAFSADELSLMVQVLRRARDVQERHVADLRHWLDEPAATRNSHQRGGLSPAALRRVQLFVEANLNRSVQHCRPRGACRAQRPSFRTCVQDVDGRHAPRVHRAASIERAHTLIEDTDQPLADIAESRPASRRRVTSRRPSGEPPGSLLRPIAGGDGADIRPVACIAASRTFTRSLVNIEGRDAPGRQGATTENTRQYLREEQRRWTGCIAGRC